MNPLRWDTVVTRAIVVVAAVACALAVTKANAQAPIFADEIASRDAADAPAGGLVGAVSADGRYVVFRSGTGLFRRDRIAGTTVRVDVDAANAPSGLASFDPPGLSADGRYVSFASTGSFGNAADNDGDYDIFVKDLSTAAIARASVRSNGADIIGSASSDCSESAISGDGKFVAFRCADGLTSWSIFVRDRAAGTTVLASVNQNAAPSSGDASSPSITLDGRYVGFVSAASDLVAGDSNGQADAFVRDTVANTTFRVSVRDNETQITGGFAQHVDVAAGCLAAFDHTANAIVAIDNNNASDVFVRNWCDGTTSFGSADDEGFAASPGESIKPSLSDDGRYLAYGSSARMVVDADFTDGGSDVYVRDRVTGGIARANLETVEGATFDGFAILPRLSGDGRQLIYTAAGGAVSDQVIAARNPVAEPLAQENVDVAAFGVGTGRDSRAASVSADGSKVVFISAASGFDRGWNGSDNDSFDDIFVYDVPANCVEQASMSDGATNGGDCGAEVKQAPRKGLCTAPEICSAAIEPAIDAAGNFVVFVAPETAVAKFRNETEKQRRERLTSKSPGFAVVLRNLVTNATFRLGTGTVGGNGTTPRVAPGGAAVVFVSGANGSGTDSNGQPDVYRQRIKPDGSPDGNPDCVSCKDGNNADLPGGAGNPSVNAGGFMVAFDQPNGSGGRDVLLRNLITGATQRLGTTAPANTRQSTAPSLDWSGTRVAFQSGASLAPADANAFADVYVFDTVSQRLELMSGGNGPSTQPSLAGDGKSVAYVTEATNLDGAEVDANGFQDVHVQEVRGGALIGGRRATLLRTRRGAYTDGASFRPAMSYNGTAVAYDTAATNILGTGTDTNGALDVFQRVVPFNADRVFEAGFE